MVSRLGIFIVLATGRPGVGFRSDGRHHAAVNNFWMLIEDSLRSI
jgi:hypothetical protein